MYSDLGHAFENLSKELGEKSLLSPEESYQLLLRVQELEAPYYSELDDFLNILVDHSDSLMRVAAMNITTAARDEFGVGSLVTFMELAPLLQDTMVLNLVAYSIKQGLILYLAERKAKKASEGLASWTVAPPAPESNPSPIQIALPLDGLPEASSQADLPSSSDLNPRPDLPVHQDPASDLDQHPQQNPLAS